VISSLLGVAGGEVIIPTLVFADGADINVAGTASLLVSLPTVAVGIIRDARRGAVDRRALRATLAPMGLGSIIRAVIGGDRGQSGRDRAGGRAERGARGDPAYLRRAGLSAWWS
jgi:hypothetical protein